MGKHVLDTEAAFIRMAANRVLRLRQDAMRRGELFHPTAGLTYLSSGYRARIRHDPMPKGHQTVVEVWPKRDGSMAREDATELASELLAHPATLHQEAPDHLEFMAYA